jgi:hypothetical protein
MCPGGLASAALTGGSVASTGDLTALVVRMVRPKRHIESEKSVNPASINPAERENENGNDQRANDEASSQGK